MSRIVSLLERASNHLITVDDSSSSSNCSKTSQSNAQYLQSSMCSRAQRQTRQSGDLSSDFDRHGTATQLGRAESLMASGSSFVNTLRLLARWLAAALRLSRELVDAPFRLKLNPRSNKHFYFTCV